MTDRIRRRLILGTSAWMLAAATPVIAALTPTPRQTAGPFYPVELPLDDDNDLTRVQGKQERARGIISDVGGRIIDINGHPLQGMHIEIWQCDANGRYRHPRENATRPIDENFQGHGAAVTDKQGAYRFRTIRPVRYPGRTPHIHIAVFPSGEEPFVTQLYIEGEPRNETDFLYNDIPWDRRHLVTASFVPSDLADAEQQASFDIILDRSDGTPQDRSGIIPDWPPA